MSDSIQVAIKVRPLIKREKDENLQIQWAVVDNVIVPVDPEKKRGENGFLFDHIFDPSKTNNDIFETVVKPIVDAAVKGFNGTVFAYGQTSSGKTYTMLGTSNESGVIPMAVERTFDSIAETGGREFLLRVSYLEIYNEKVNDLLDTTKVDLKLREDSNGLVQVLNCKEEIASSPDVIMAIMKKGDKNRRVGETDMNDRSSRSHTIFRITIESRDLSSDSDGAIQVSQLNLVDLAGSERARLTNATGERFKEGTHINQSLSTLGLVIKQLSESSDNNKYINFRDSKLTRILQASLGGNAMTTIICAVTPAAFEETQCTLSFASRAKSVKNKPQLNEVMSDAALLKRYKKQLAKLSEELEKVKNENRIVEAQEMESKLQEKEYKLQETHRINQILEERIQLLKNSIVSADSATKDNSSLKHSRFKRRRTWAGDRVLNYRFSTCSQNLPTINEISCTSPDSKSNNSEKLENVKRRKSIIQTVNFNDESFETAFTDFELELIKVAKEREEQTDTTIDFAEAKDLQKINLKPENRVKFQDNVEIFRLSSGSNWSDVSTPEKQRSSLSQGDRTQESSSPGTPKAVLRERLNYMIEEYNTLQEFTTLEKQMLFAQQVDFDSPTEKTFMQKQMDELLGRLGKYSSYQTELEELLTVSLNCINRLTSSTPGILELWKPTVFNDDKGEFDTCRELKQLEEILTNLKSEQSDSERALTPLEKKLTNDYNECLQELEQIRSQKQLLLIENIEIKKKLADESNKLKATDTLIKSLRVDTDCLMQKLIEKNNELVKLKKKIVQLERINDVTEKSVCISSPEVSTKNENEANMSTKLNLVDETQNKDFQISKLKEIIEEKALEIAKYRQFEEEMKIENERLQSLDAVSKLEEKGCQTQTIPNYENRNKSSLTIEQNQNKDAEISKLTNIIEEKALSIIDYQKREVEMKEKIEQLQQYLGDTAKVEKASQECQTENVFSYNEGSNLVEQNKEIMRLSEIIQEKTAEISNYKQYEEQMKEEIKPFLNVVTGSKIEQRSTECQTLYFQNHEENSKIDVSNKDTEIAKLEGVIEEKTLEITRLQQIEEESKKEIERLQFCLNSTNKIEKSSVECQSEDIFRDDVIEKNITNYLSHDKSNEISGLMELIHLKSVEIESYKKSEENMSEKIKQLQQCLGNVKKIEQNAKECQTETFAEQYIEVDTIKEKDNEISRLSEFIEEQTLVIEKYKILEEELKNNIEQLQNSLNVDKSGEVTSAECQTESMSNNETNFNQEKDNEISRLAGIVQEKTLEIEKCKISEEELKNNIEQLLHSLNAVKNAEISSAECQTESLPNNESNSNQEKDNEISRLSEVIEEKTLMIEKYKILEEELKNNIEQLQHSLNVVKNVDVISAECQTESTPNNESNSNQEKDNEISRLSEVIEEKILMIEKYKILEEELKNNIEQLQQSQSSVKNTELMSTECHTEYTIDNKIDINHEKDNKICRLSEIIQEKTFEIEKYKILERELKNNIEQLQQSQSSVKNTKLLSTECQTECIVDNEIDINHAKDNEIFRLSEIIQEKALEIEKYKQTEEEMNNQMERLQQCLDNIKEANQTSSECQTEYQLVNESNTVEHNVTGLNATKDSEIAKLLESIQKKEIEIAHQKQAEVETRKEIERLQQCLDTIRKVEQMSKECQTDVGSDIVKYNKQDINAEKRNEISRPSEIITTKTLEIGKHEEIETLNEHAEILKEGFANARAEFEAKLTTLNDELITKLTDIDALNSLNFALRNGIDEKTNEIANLQQTFEFKLQKLEQKIDVIVLERNQLKEKIDSSYSNNLTQDFVKEAAHLKAIVDELKEENDILRKRLVRFETEYNNSLSATMHENLISLTSPIKSSDIELQNILNNSVTSPFVNLEENKHSISVVTAEKCENMLSHGDSFIKPVNVLVEESKDSVPVTTELNVSVAANNANLAKSVSKTFELESSSIFANLTYFDNMEVGQSFVQDYNTLLTGIDGCKDISDTSENINNLLGNDEIKNETAINATVLLENTKEVNKTEDIQSVPLIKVDNVPLTMEELEKINVALEKENTRLCYDLQKKIQETEEVQKVISDFKQTLEELQQTIYILTNENMDMSRQLTEARESNNLTVNNFQREIDTLAARLSAITEEKVSLKSELTIMQEQFENMRAITPVLTDDELKHKFFEYQEKIRSLTEENIELSTNLMEKLEELEKVKESKIQLYDHQCTYREKSELLVDKMQCLEKENIELSSELTEQIEECDKLKETVDVLKKQLEAFSNQQSTENHNKDDFEFFKQENTRLSNELIELRAKLTQLSRENANLSTHLVLNNSDEHNISTNISHSKPLNVSSIPLETSVSEEYTGETNKISFMNEKDKNLQEQVEHLTLLNKKLGELKLTNCSRCTHLKELNESRRLLKLEVKSLNQKLSDLQKKFQQKCADTEVWRMKANEDLNTSLNLIDATLNGSIYDGVNVTVIEEKVQNLHCELEELKENHNKLSNQYKEKCNELEKLQFDNNTIASQKSEKKETKRSKLDTPTRKHSSRIQAVEKQLDNLSNELQDLKKHNANVSSTLNKFMVERNELVQSSESLKLENEELRKECNAAKADALYYEEKVKLVEEELAALYKRIEVSNTTEKEIQAEKLKIEVQFESLLKEKSELTTSLQETEKKFRKELEECNTLVQNYEKENINLRNELQQLETVIQQLKGKKDNCAEEKLKQEIESAKSRILKEVRSLASLSENEIKELPTKSVTDIFLSFLTTILSKETEIVKRLQEEFERSKQKLEEEKQQCIDAERRANGWAKTLETDLEKLQGDLTEQEQKNRRLQNEIHRLADNLRESQHENQQLHNNIVNLEGDLNLLQNELDKKSKTNIDRDSVILAVQEKERLARTKEVEWENRLKLEKEDHNRELEELNVHLESYKSINEDLKNTVEGLDLEIEHLKNTIDIKTNDFNLCMHKLEEMQKVIEHLEESNQQLKIENLEKKKHADEITGLFKIKCDLLTEYKNKVETMKPEYENLHSQIAERKICIEKFKEEIHNLKLENKKQADILQDKLSGEEIKSAGLNKQVAELKNKNTALCSTIEEFKDRCAELERENASLQRKVRNSTSKVRVESEMQELQDENRSLKNHLEGSYNRIKELQETKSQVQRELMEAQGKNELLEQELNTTKIALGSLREKYNNMNLQKLREKYELLLREKNNVILEIEEKKMLIANKDQKLVEYSIEIDTLNRQKKGLDREVENIKRDNSLLQNQISDLVIEIQKLNQNISSCNIEKDEACKLIVEEKNKIALELENCQKEKSELMKQNKELDEEMDDLVKHIHKQEDEIAELQDRLITGSSSGIVEKLKILEDDNEKLKIDLRVTELNRTKLQNEVLRLNSEKEQLLSRIDDLNGRIAELESKNSSRSSSKTSSPTSRKGRRRNRRSDLYNQKRNLDFDSDSTESPSVTPTPIIKSSNEECSTCSELRNRIREMSLDLVSRNNKITMLEVQLQSENFPYQMKCNELQENLLAVKTRNSELKLEIHKLQRALMEDSSRECQMCRHRKLNRRDQSVQVNPEKKICLTGMSSGIVEDHIRLEKMEKERNWMKDLCRSRARKIKELEQHIKELEDLKTS